MSKKHLSAMIAILIFAVAAGRVCAKTAAELEKEKAMAEPYPNDFGPEELDPKVLKTYPKGVQDGYRLLLKKCGVCHTSARPLNSQFVETGGKKKADRMAATAKLKKTNPELFKNKALWQIEGAIWQRYVKRMMAKPGCDISKPEGKLIWKFLSHDSRERKLKQRKDWTALRGKLLKDFKKEHPKRYKELFEH